MTTDIDLFKNIGLMLQCKLENLCYPNSENKVFKKVLLGFDEQKIRIQGDGVVAVCYVRGANDFTETFGKHNIPHYVNTVIAFVIRGSGTDKYNRAIGIIDLILKELQTNHDFIRLETSDGKRTVRDTDIINIDLTLDKITGNKLDTIGAFTLRHHVFK